MRIKALRLSGFQSWHEATLAFEKPVTLVLGGNNAGKTGIARAIELSLRGSTPLKGAQIVDMIRDGFKSAMVTADIERETPLKVERTLTAKGYSTTINGNKATKDVTDYFCPPGLLDPDAVLSVVLNVSGFFSLEPAKQKAILESLVDQSVPEAVMFGLTLDPYVPGPPKTLDDVDEAYKAVYEKRRVANAQAVALRPVSKPEKPAPAATLIPAIEKKLRELREQQHVESRITGEQHGRRVELERRRDELTKREEELAGSRELLEDAVGKAAHFQVLVEEIDKQHEGRAQKNARLKVIDAWDKSLGALGGKCVISADIACPLEKLAKDKVRKGWGEEREQLKQAIGSVATDLEAAAAREDLAAARQKAEQFQRDVAELVRTTRDLGAVATELAALPPDEPGVADTEEQQALARRIAKGEENLTEARDLTKAWADWTTYDAERQRVATAQQELDALVKAFGPGGMREVLLSTRLGVLEGKMNDALKRFGLSLTFTSGETWAPRINGRAVATASESERYRASIGLQIALAQLCGVKFMVVDGADILDTDNRKALFGMLDTALKTEMLEQCIVTATLSNEAALSAKRPEWMGLIHIALDQHGASQQMALPALEKAA